MMQNYCEVERSVEEIIKYEKRRRKLIQRFRFMVFIRCNGWPAW